MTIEQGIHERLLSLSPVTALVGSRVYQLKLPQKPTLPAIRVQQISEADEHHLRGRDGVVRTRIQVDAYAHESAADPYATATAVAAAVHGDGLGPGASGLSGFAGGVGGSPSSLQILFAERVARVPEYESDELRLVRIRQDYMVTWKET